MPFPQQSARAFTRVNVEGLKPNQIGCYGLFRDRGPWVYVGRGDIRARLLAHLNGDNSCITKEGPTHWMDVLTNDDAKEEMRLILEYGPICNQKVG